MSDSPFDQFVAGKDQRRSERVPLMLDISVSLGGADYQAVLLNISGEGAKVQVRELGSTGVTKGSLAEINVPRFGAFEGSIVWVDDIFFGMEFDENHKVTAALIREMALDSN